MKPISLAHDRSSANFTLSYAPDYPDTAVNVTFALILMVKTLAAPYSSNASTETDFGEKLWILEISSADTDGIYCIPVTCPKN